MVVAIRGSDCTDCLGMADRGSNLRVAARFASRNLPQLPPDRLLEGGSGDVDWKVGRREGGFDCLESSSNELAHSAFVLDDGRIGKQPPKRRVAIFEGQHADR